MVENCHRFYGELNLNEVLTLFAKVALLKLHLFCTLGTCGAEISITMAFRQMTKSNVIERKLSREMFHFSSCKIRRTISFHLPLKIFICCITVNSTGNAWDVCCFQEPISVFSKSVLQQSCKVLLQQGGKLQNCSWKVANAPNWFSGADPDVVTWSH